MPSIKFLAAVICALIALQIQSAVALHDYPASEFWLPSNETTTRSINHSAWQNILDRFVQRDSSSQINLVDYAALKAEAQQDLQAYIKTLSELDIRGYARSEQFAYWVNLYNALTVNLIVENHPVKSITKISAGWFSFGPWDDAIITIQGQSLSLNDIEHRILRPIWQDYRIHFVVNCASLGCPNLAKTALNGGNSERLLNAAATEFLQHPRGLEVAENSLTLSKIFKWYQRDFGADESALLKTLSPFIPANTRATLSNKTPRIKYQYDWSLNGL